MELFIHIDFFFDLRKFSRSSNKYQSNMQIMNHNGLPFFKPFVYVEKLKN